MRMEYLRKEMESKCKNFYKAQNGGPVIHECNMKNPFPYEPILGPIAGSPLK